MSYVDELIAQGYGGYRGWGESEARADFNATGGQGKYTGGNSSSSSSSSVSYDPIAEAQKLNQWYRQQNQPYIQSLQQGIPEVQKSYEQSRGYLQGQAEPLTQRYQNLLNDLKNTASTSVKKQEIATSSELGRRGFVGGGLYDQTILNATQPIEKQYATDISNVGIAQEQDMASLMNQIAQLSSSETSQLREIQNAIAQAEAGNPQAAMSSAENLLSLKQNQQQFQEGQELQRFLGTYSGASNPYMALSEGQTLYNMLTGQAEYTAPKTYKTTSASDFGDPLGLM